MIYLGQQHLGLVAGGDQIRGSALDALFKGSVQHLDFIAGLGDLACIAEDGDRDAADDNDDDQSADHRDPAKPGRVAALFGDSGRQPFIGSPDDARQKDVGLVHQRLAAVAAKQGQRIGIVKIALQSDRAVHFIELFRDHVGQPLDHAVGLR